MKSAREIAIEEGIRVVLAKEADDWKEAYLNLAAKFFKGRKEFHGGQLCEFCRKQGLPEPHHHNVWGAMLLTLRALGWIKKKRYVEPDTPQSHINRVVLWEVSI